MCHSSDLEAELDSVSFDDERRPGPIHDIETFGLGNGDSEDFGLGTHLVIVVVNLAMGTSSSSRLVHGRVYK
jgi:hypothetical protein